MNLINRVLSSFRGATALLGPDRALRVSPLVRASAHDGGLALLHIASGQIFLCNRTGSRIWEGLSQGMKPEDVADEISRKYGVERNLAQQDILSFVGELERRGLMIRTAEC